MSLPSNTGQHLGQSAVSLGQGLVNFGETWSRLGQDLVKPVVVNMHQVFDCGGGFYHPREDSDGGWLVIKI